MCLFATTQKPLIAEEDIRVYKVVRVKGGKYWTPYRDVLLSERPSCQRRIAKKCGDVFTVAEEGTHAFINRSLAFDTATFFSNSCIIEGTIPKGTRYWKNTAHTEIASKYIDFGLKEYKESWLKRLIRKRYLR